MAMKRRSNHEGSILQRGPHSWRAQISINDLRISFSGKTKKECQEWLHQRNVEIDSGYNLSKGRVSVEVYLHQWIEIKARKVKQNTLTQYTDLINLKIIPYIGKKLIRDLSRQDIDSLYSLLEKKGVGSPTIRYTHRVLHCALEDAVKSDLLLRNPAKYATPPRYIPPEMEILEEFEISRFLEAARLSRYEVIYHLALTTGMRQGEILGLKWSDIRWQTASLNIKRQVIKNNGEGFTFTSPKTRSGIRVIPVSETCLQMLRLHHEQQNLVKAFAGDKWQEQNLVFTSTIGTPIDRSNLRKEFQTVLKNSNLPPIRFHDLRHTAATHMLNRGTPPIVVCNILGHSKPSVTLDTYGHSITSMQDKAARIMDDLITLPQIEVKTSSEEPVINKPPDTRNI